MSDALAAFGTFLIWNYHKLLELTSITGPSESMDTIDVTSHDSADGYREFVHGVFTGGDISIEGNLLPTDADGQVSFHTDMQAGTKRTCWLVLPMAAAAALTFSAYAKGFSASYPVADKIAVSGSLQMDGKPTMYVTQSTGISALAGIEENEEAALSLNGEVAAGTYAYTCTVNTASTWVKLTVTAASHVVYIDGVLEETAVQTDEITLGDAGTDTDILIIVYETAKAPRLYTLTVTRPAA